MDVYHKVTYLNTDISDRYSSHGVKSTGVDILSNPRRKLFNMNRQLQQLRPKLARHECFLHGYRGTRSSDTLSHAARRNLSNSPVSSSNELRGPLQGLKVLDLSRVLAARRFTVLCILASTKNMRYRPHFAHRFSRTTGQT